ncbi:hypothetical protein DFH06DRAFT_598804 [Mycena polygramma]|nr:hypothetical protein DFH06DRAFT_598804 [Mycena polygramma]
MPDGICLFPPVLLSRFDLTSVRHSPRPHLLPKAVVLAACFPLHYSFHFRISARYSIIMGRAAIAHMGPNKNDSRCPYSCSSCFCASRDEPTKCTYSRQPSWVYKSLFRRRSLQLVRRYAALSAAYPAGFCAVLSLAAVWNRMSPWLWVRQAR